ncbi:RagB/SusD family nutrient uptake outer membrane protein [Sphingobacterium sp.]|uniref:RagB/SusD family nutrient uptake outer membrane protein n=1 Tax=Sphingobacterium sp. TaxID=341027 RepID=UPI0028AF3D8C|nr:RagB/SusD family nutrient uptake outer membrane protein [Sphingobacterium sp.]
MKKLNLFTISIMLLLSGCSKFLDTSPDMRTELDSPTKIAELLTSAYPRGNYIPFIEAASDNADDKGLSLGSGDPLNQNPWKFEDVEARDQDSPTYYWYAAYKAISAANHALKAIEKLNLPDQTRSLKGEALVARAYAHHMLAIIFAPNYEEETANKLPGIPYVTEPETEVVKKYERKSVKYVYEMIEKDLIEGIPLLDNNRYKVPKFHFTTSAAHAFATRFYLFKKDYHKAAEHGDLALGENLDSYVRPINSTDFRFKEYFEKEKYYSDATTPTNLLLVEAPSIWGRNLMQNRYGLTSPLMVELFHKPNVAAAIYGYTIFGGNESYIHIPKFREHFVKASINASYGIPHNMIPLITADELLLNRAEAFARIKKFDRAITDLNVFIKHKVAYNLNVPFFIASIHTINSTRINLFYGSQDLESNIVKAAVEFRRREFIFEGLRWFDILRHNIPVTHISKDKKEKYFLGINSPKRVFQLPDEVIMSGIEPNPR